MIAINPDTDIPLLTDKVILVTGGTDGLGKECVRQMSLRSPARIYLAGRNKVKAERVLEELSQSHPDHAPVTFLEMELGSLASVQAAAAQFLSKNHRLDILMNNGGSMAEPSVTGDGYETCFAVNYLGHALLTQLLLPVLRKTAELPGSDVRVVNLTSMAERYAPKQYTFDKMRTGLPELGVMSRYGQSKLASIHQASILAQKYPQITFVSVHPGMVQTNFLETFGKIFWKGMQWARPLIEFIAQLVLKVDTVEEGARGQLWCATTHRNNLKNGEFYWPVGVLGKGTTASKDMKRAKALSDWTDRQLRGYL